MSGGRPPTERVRDLLVAASELPADERAAFVRRTAEGDERLHREVMSLLKALECGGDLLEVRTETAETPGVDSLTGFRFSSYLIEERIGSGGMGIVHRATDTRLGRSVAVKALPPHSANNAVRRARLEHEARALAALNHPNIASIYGAEDTERGALLLLEFVPGTTLAQRIAAGPLPIEELIQIARQIALGLEAAHALGVVHRDLKPSNVRLTDDGIVKILDFGIAEILAEPRGGGSGEQDSRTPDTDATTSPAGSAPRVLGTAAYMSPEQARGRKTDRRCDLWAFGCLLYELLTRSRPFAGDTRSEVIAAVLQFEPDMTRLPPSTPPSLRRLVERCLRKDPATRLRDAADARLDLDDALAELRHAAAEPTPPSRSSSAAMLIVGLATAACGFLIRGSALFEAPPDITRFGVHAEQSLPLEWDPGASFAIAPSGDHIAFTGFRVNEPQRLFLQAIDELQPRTIEVAGMARTPSYSPDGTSVAYSEVTTGRLMRYDLATGTAAPIGQRTTDASGIAWADENTIVFSESRVLWIAPIGGGDATQLTSLDSERHDVGHGQACALGGSDWIFFTCQHRDAHGERYSLEAVRRTGRDRHTIRDDAWGAMTLGEDVLLWCEGAAIRAARIDPRSGQTNTAPVTVLEPIAGSTEAFPVARAALSRNGTLVYLPGGSNLVTTDLGWMHRDGRIERLVTDDHPVGSPRLSPDGSLVAYARAGSQLEVWVRDIRRGTSRRLANADGRNRDYPFWERGGDRLLVASWDDNTYRIEELSIFTGEGPRILLERPRSEEPTANDVLPDGSGVLITMRRADGSRDLYRLPLEGGEPMPIFGVPDGRTAGRFSPRGDAIAYVVEQPGLIAVFVERWPELDRRVQVSQADGFRAEWRSDGNALYYRHRSELWEVEVSMRPELAAGRSQLISDAFPNVRYAVDNEGARFLTPLPAGDRRSGTQFGVVRHFDRVIREALAGASAR